MKPGMKQSFRVRISIYFLLQISWPIWGQPSFADCINAKMLCDKAPIVVNELSGFGSLSEPNLGACFRKDFTETNSIWLKWKVAEAGTLAFTILPINESDDIDFVLYRLKGADNCALKETVRCMAAGPNIGSESEFYLGCTGATGLRLGTNIGSQPSGCTKDGENFLSPIEMKEGEFYALFINNFRSAEGFLIEWSGSGSFQPTPEHCLPHSNISNFPVLHNDGHLVISEPFPNPTSDRVSIAAFSNEELQGELQIISSDGQLELTRAYSISVGNNSIELPVENLRTGVHFVKLRANGETHLLRFVKH